MMPRVTRYEDMSPDGRLELLKQPDGDVIVVVTAYHLGEFRQAEVEFCTPMSGGGQSERTWQALLRLMEEMDADNKLRPQQRNGVER